MPLYDFECLTCETVFEKIVPSTQKAAFCACGGVGRRLISARIGLLNDPNKRAESLKKRSKEHSVKQMRENPERLAKLTGAKPRSQNPWNVRNR